MDHRYFIARSGSALFAAFTADHAERRRVTPILVAFMKKIKADSMYGSTPKSYAFAFKKTPDSALWKRLEHVNAYVPKARLYATKALREEIAALPAAPALNDCLRAIGFDRWGHFLIDNMCRMWRPAVRFYSTIKGESLIIVAVPWREVDVKRIAKYQKDRAAGNGFNAEMDYLLWVPPADIEEVKEWQALELIDRLSAKDKEDGH
jgi:hypothetical protein